MTEPKLNLRERITEFNQERLSKLTAHYEALREQGLEAFKNNEPEDPELKQEITRVMKAIDDLTRALITSHDAVKLRQQEREFLDKRFLETK